MFTGIIQNLGKAINFSNGELEVTTSLDLSDCNVGSSICCNGVCLTTTEIEFKSNLHYFKATVGEETQQRTTFSNNLFNELISMNLEKSLKIGDEISGHFVYGHVDRTTELLKVNNFNNSWEFCFKNFQWIFIIFYSLIFFFSSIRDSISFKMPINFTSFNMN